ncbi:hypothetical protein Vadar_027799 [Vaccinium darrowii]|uniref:Uncharacterized protein n=1 Tax=Vaccinium darrowii TaxID=229202 RepID=A0ACB7X4Y8_9ERIC|nr:hypothetical protein Vadar_027799 [Vaccinium darrowii]
MAPRKLFDERPLLEDPPSASPSEEEEDNRDQQPSKETQESEFFSVGEGEGQGEGEEEEEEEEQVEVAKNTTTEEGGEEEEEEEINNTTRLSHPKSTPKEEEKPGRSVGNRLWSEDDEITILEGMINYHSKKGTDPYSEIDEFHEFIKNSLSVDASMRKFVDKVRKMKVKYNKNVEKGEGAVFSKPPKPHDVKCFELSKKIWAVGGGGKQKRNGVDGNGKRGSKRVRKTVELDEKAGGSGGRHQPSLNQSLAREAETLPFDLSMDERLKSIMMANMSMIGGVKAKELKKKGKDLVVDKVAMYLREVELAKEWTELILDDMKASKG